MKNRILDVILTQCEFSESASHSLMMFMRRNEEKRRKRRKKNEDSDLRDNSVQECESRKKKRKRGRQRKVAKLKQAVRVVKNSLPSRITCTIRSR